MKQILTIIKKELQGYFNSPLAYIFITVFLVTNSWLFFQNYFLIGQADMRGFFYLIPWMFLFLIPAITMRSWAEEKKMGTLEVILTLPVSDTRIVLGKFFASFLFLAFTLVLSMVIAIVVRISGPADLGVIFASYLGALLLGASYIALGLFLSALTDNQIIAFIGTLVISFVFLIIGEAFVLQSVPSFLAPVFQFLGLGSHFSSISRGVIDSRDLLFYFSFTGYFLFLNVQQIAGRRFQ